MRAAGIGGGRTLEDDHAEPASQELVRRPKLQIARPVEVYQRSALAGLPVSDPEAVGVNVAFAEH